MREQCPGSACSHTSDPWEVIVIADLDTLLTALYVELTDRIISSLGLASVSVTSYHRSQGVAWHCRERIWLARARSPLGSGIHGEAREEAGCVASAEPVNGLVTGPVFRFADWPNGQVPRRAAGVYTIWRQAEFIYVGMSGRGAKAQDFVAGQGLEDQAKWLWTRLGSHASGRRSGDQFNVYICDRFVVPALTPGQQRDVGEGKLLLDQMTKDFIRRHLSYRFVVYPNGAEALAAERTLRGGQSPAGHPYLNPL